MEEYNWTCLAFCENWFKVIYKLLNVMLIFSEIFFIIIFLHTVYL